MEKLRKEIDFCNTCMGTRKQRVFGVWDKRNDSWQQCAPKQRCGNKHVLVAPPQLIRCVSPHSSNQVVSHWTTLSHEDAKFSDACLSTVVRAS